MTVNFHRWEVDPFFCAAEEVQDSADRLESVYRTWLQVKSVADDVSAIEFHKRELGTALGTAKWQLEEFERAVSCVTTYDCDQGGDDAPSRHKQFVDALHNQISTIETALSSSKDRRDSNAHQVLRLGEKEKDDLALFLCGSRSTVEGKVGDGAILKGAKPEEVVPCLRIPLDRKHGPLLCSSMSAANSDADFRAPGHDTCLWMGDTSLSDKLLPDLHDTEIRSFSGRRIEDISKPVSDPTPEYFHSDRGEPGGEGLNGHYRSVSVGNGLNAWKSGLTIDVKKKRRRLISAEVSSSRLSFWPIFDKLCHTRKFDSGFKRWKDGDVAKGSEMLALMQDTHDMKQGNQASCLGTKKMFLNCNESGDFANGDIRHQTVLQDGFQMWQRAHYSVPFGRLVPIASAILVALGLVGFLSFHVTSSSL